MLWQLSTRRRSTKLYWSFRIFPQYIAPSGMTVWPTHTCIDGSKNREQGPWVYPMFFGFYVSCPAFSFSFLLLRGTSTASARSQCSPPDPNSKLRIRAFPAGPQLQALDRSVPRRTRTATSGSKCILPDLHRKLRIKVFPAGPQPQAPGQSVPRRTSTTKNLRRCTR